MSTEISYCPFCGSELPENSAGSRYGVVPEQKVCDVCDRLLPRQIDWWPTAKTWISPK
jgi:RNA polymerase subunit RPABC4/transcription elongation factor Spt4